MHRFITPMVVLPAALIAACDPGRPMVCTASIEPGIVVEIRDAQTGAPLAQHAAGAARDGAFVDSLRPYGFLESGPTSMYSRRAADERPGRYEVEVQLPAYASWTASDVRVVDGDCHVRTVTLQASLQPSS